MSEKIEKIYGKHCDTKNLVMINSPFPLKLSWNTRSIVRKIQCHKLIAEDLENILKDILKEYGQEKITELGIDIYGGCYNCRPMRGGTKQSMHSWGIAIDIFPELNGLKTPFKKSQFSKPEYKPMIDIFYKYGWENLGVEKGYDAMHFQVKI